MREDTPKIAFLILLGLLMMVFVALVRPFFLPALFALIIAVICNPIYKFLLRTLWQKNYIASFAATVIVCLCVILPMGMAVFVIVLKASEAVGYTVSQLEGGHLAGVIDQLNGWLQTKIFALTGFSSMELDLRAMLLGFLKSIGKVVYQYSPRVIAATVNLVALIFLVIVFLFVFFAEGKKLYKTIFGLLPLKEDHKEILAREIRLTISATFLGMIATSLAQGFLIGIGFWIAGISNPPLWGLVTVGVALVPVIGGPLMYIPAAAVLLSEGHLGAGIFLLVYGVGIISTVDNVIKPLVMRGKVNTHPVLLALSLIGGGLWLGPGGIIVGPLVVVLMLACLRIYQREF